MRGSIYRKSKTSPYILKIELPPGPDGKRRQKEERCPIGTTKPQAERILRERILAMENGTYVEPTKMTVGDLMARWLAEYAKHNVASKTYERYEGIVNRGIIPALGHIHLSTLRPDAIQSFYNKLLTEGRSDGTGGLSAKTVLQYHRIFRKALKWAVQLQFLALNPTDRVTAPRPARVEIKPPSKEEVQKLLSVAKETAYYTSVVLAATTGMRLGEILGLKWTDISLEKGILMVSRSLQHTKAEGLTFKEPKSRSSRRAITLGDSTVAALAAHKKVQEAHKERLGDGYEDGGLVCPRPDGRPINPDNFSRDVKVIFRKAGLGHVRFHDLRHFVATELIAAGMSHKVVQDRLGHSTPQITLDMYTHVSPATQRESALLMDNVLTGLNTDESSPEESAVSDIEDAA